MPSGVDQVSDANAAEFVRLSRLYDFPEYVKQEKMARLFEPGAAAVTTYADPVRRQYPCHTKAATWVSALYFAEKAAEFHAKDRDRIAARIDHYADFWQIRGDVSRVREKRAGYEKEASAALPDSAYAYVWVDDATGRKDRHLPMRNAAEVKAAADYLHRYQDRFRFADRHVMAGKILEKAARFGAAVGPLVPFLEKQAGRGVGDPDRVAAMIDARARLTDNPAVRREIVKLAAACRGKVRQVFTPETMVKLAETVDDLDRQIGLAGKYTDAIPRPEDVIFAATFSKAAAEADQLCPVTTGRLYRKQDFTKIALSDVRDLFGTDFADEVRGGPDAVDPEKLAEVVSTLPRNDAELFDRLADEAGVNPTATKSAAARYGFDEGQLKALADSYAKV